jgi:hypothetical protein
MILGARRGGDDLPGGRQWHFGYQYWPVRKGRCQVLTDHAPPVERHLRSRPDSRHMTANWAGSMTSGRITARRSGRSMAPSSPSNDPVAAQGHLQGARSEVDGADPAKGSQSNLTSGTAAGRTAASKPTWEVVTAPGGGCVRQQGDYSHQAGRHINREMDAARLQQAPLHPIQCMSSLRGRTNPGNPHCGDSAAWRGGAEPIHCMNDPGGGTPGRGVTHGFASIRFYLPPVAPSSQSGPSDRKAGPGIDSPDPTFDCRTRPSSKRRIPIRPSLKAMAICTRHAGGRPAPCQARGCGDRAPRQHSSAGRRECRGPLERCRLPAPVACATATGEIMRAKRSFLNSAAGPMHVLGRRHRAVPTVIERCRRQMAMWAANPISHVFVYHQCPWPAAPAGRHVHPASGVHLLPRVNAFGGTIGAFGGKWGALGPRNGKWWCKPNWGGPLKCGRILRPPAPRYEEGWGLLMGQSTPPQPAEDDGRASADGACP